MEGATAAISIISFAFQAFQGCVQAFQFFYTAQHIGSDGDLLRTHLEFEKYRLMNWAEEVGIEPTRFRNRENLNWQLARMYLEQLRAFMNTTELLKERYGLDLTAESIEAGAAKPNLEAAEHGIGRLLRKLKPSIYTTAGKVIQASNGPIKRLRWATGDRDKLMRFVGEIRTIIDNLERLLDHDEQKRAGLEYERVVRGLISLCPTVADVEQVIDVVVDDDGPQHSESRQAMRAAAFFKQIRLAVGADQREDEVRPASLSHVRTEVPKLKKLKRALRPWGQAPELRWAGLEFASYHGQQVLIQWKTAEGPAWVRHQNQMKLLTVLLMSVGGEPSFRSPRCVGYCPMEEHGAHGIVYGMPADSVDWDLRTLRDIMAACPLVSLARRLEIARALAETVLQLHTAGWMHKNLCSANIVFLATRQAETDGRVFLRSQPYLVGYDYARPDTAEAAAKYTQPLDDVADLEAELYRHPQARGAHREVYQKRFDLYALACVLVELVTWKPLASVMAAHAEGREDLQAQLARASEHREAVDIPSLQDLFASKSAEDCLAYHVGPTLVEAITACASVDKAKDGEEGLLREQTDIVNKLSWCRI